MEDRPGDRRHLYVQPMVRIHPEVEDLVIQSIDMLVITTKCPHCQCPIRYPVVAHEAQLQRLDDIYKLASQWCASKGMTNDLLASIRTQIAIGMAKKPRRK